MKYIFKKKKKKKKLTVNNCINNAQFAINAKISFGLNIEMND